MGIGELEKRLLIAAQRLNYQVLLGPKRLGGVKRWDKRRRLEYNREASRGRRAWGLCDYHNKVIWLEGRMHPQHRVSVLAHELGHALLHNQYKIYRPLQWEAEAEEVRRLVGEGVGIDLPANNNDLARLGPWGKGKARRRGRRASRRLLRLAGPDSGQASQSAPSS